MSQEKLHQLVRDEHANWAEQRDRYLGLKYGLGRADYDASCPPLLFMCNHTERPSMIVVSLEPKKASHFPLVRDALTSAGVDCNLNYFNTFPDYSHSRDNPQVYWRRLAMLAAGWAGEAMPASAETWSVLGRNVMEVPLVPMHSEVHDSRSQGDPALVLSLFERRMRLALERVPDALVLVLGASHEAALCKPKIARPLLARRQDAYGPVERELTADEIRRFGSKFDLTLARYDWAPDLNLPNSIILGRHALTSGYQPSDAGILELGRCLRRDFGVS